MAARSLAAAFSCAAWAQGHIIYSKVPAPLPEFAKKLGFVDTPEKALLADWGRATTRKGRVNGKDAVSLVFLRQKGTVGMVNTDFVAVALATNAKSKTEAEKACAEFSPKGKFGLISINELYLVNAYAGPLPRLPNFSGDKEPVAAASAEGTWIEGWNEPSIRTQHLPGMDLSDGDGGPEHRGFKDLISMVDKTIQTGANGRKLTAVEVNILERFKDYVRGGFEVVCVARPKRR